MKVIVGLGNPGKQYEGTRHNVGRELAEKIAKRFDIELEENKKYMGPVGKGEIGDENVLIMLPDTYMNKSGKAVASAVKVPKNLIVIQDDTDIPLGTAKIVIGRNSGGHKGIESIMRAIKSKEFWRIRVGVAKPKKSGGTIHKDAMNIVLKKFAPAEKLVIKKVEKKILEAIEEPLFVTTLSV
ncbi:MAG: aminoacyl-tRNA hydrolase [bacterium]|nr:aminoacyl-tRNA hydrolase [bacterium]